MKGIILAGGTGTRLYPITKSISKQLLCIYDKPMIYYPLSTLLNAGIKEILIISTPHDIDSYIALLGSGNNLGINLTYIKQPQPDGIAQAFILAEEFIGDDNVCLILGDNIFHGHNFDLILKESISSISKNNNATIFGYYVNNPSRYGVLCFENENIVSIEEKPEIPKSNYAIVGLYFYPNDVIKIAKKITPSERGELEIAAVNNQFLKDGKLDVKILDSGITWLDTGTPDSLLEASNFIQAIEKRQGRKIACIEEIAYRNGYISKKQLIKISELLLNSEYGRYLSKIIDQWN